MDALVTGATGFTGSNLAIALAKAGYSVRGLCREGSDTAPLIEHGIEICTGDITDADAVDKAVQGCEKVYHIAACFRTAGHNDDYYRQVNRDGTQYVLEAAKRHGCERVVHCSTGGVHGHITKKVAPADENAPIKPGDIYQTTKLEGEQLAQQAIKDGQRVTIFRPAGIYGPGDMRLLKLFKTVHKGTFFMFGKGEVHFGLVYIDDLVDGIMLMGEKEEAIGETFILCGPDELPLKDLVNVVAEAVGSKPPRMRWPIKPLLAASWMCEMVCIPFGIEPPIHRRRAHVFTKNREFTHAKATRILGYQPKIAGVEGMHRTAQWYFDQGLLKGDYPHDELPVPEGAPA